MKKRPMVLTIAGFDPSGGAGLTADIKTLEALKCYGLAVCTANTIQNDVGFDSCYWIDSKIIKNQISILFERFQIDFVKIGIVESWFVLKDIIEFLFQKNSKLKIILDPVLTSSSNFDFHKDNAEEYELDETLNKIYLLTPNYQEIQKLFPEKEMAQAIQYISSKTNLLVKGGHRKENIGKDELYTIHGKHFTLNPKGNNISEKHGSGCILSSAITGKLALGFPLLKACYQAKRYTEKVLKSNKSLLGYHNI